MRTPAKYNTLIKNGKDINDLLSTQFCQKVYELFINDKLEMIEG